MHISHVAVADKLLWVVECPREKIKIIRDRITDQSMTCHKFYVEFHIVKV